MIWFIITIGIVLIIGGILFLMFYHPKDNNSTIDRAQNISQDKYDPNMTRFRARKEATASQARVELLTAVNAEIGLLSQTIDHEAAALKAGYNKEDTLFNHQLQREKTVIEHEAYIALADNTKVTAQMATQLGVDPLTMRELILERARMETQLSMQYREMELEVEKHKRLSEVNFHFEIEKHRQVKEIDFSYDRQLAELDTQMADIANLLPQHQLNLLNTQLASIHQEYEHINTLIDSDFKKRELQRVSLKMKTWKKEIRERAKGLS